MRQLGQEKCAVVISLLSNHLCKILDNIKPYPTLWIGFEAGKHLFPYHNPKAPKIFVGHDGQHG
jgi:hypothetical protein